MQHPTTRAVWFAYALAITIAATATTLLFHILLTYGTHEGVYDSACYLSGAFHLVQGNGFTLKLYDVATDTIAYQPITHYPPFTSLVYAGFLLLGVPLIDVAVWVNISCWLIFLAGIGTLTYRLSRARWGAAVAVAIVAISNAYLYIFQAMMSEPVFLPLLVWSVVALLDMPKQERVSPARMGIVIILLAMLMLTRYVGVFIYGAIGMWWVWHRWQQQRLRQLVWEVPLFGVAFVPFAAWLVRNWLVSVEVLGKHTEQKGFTFWDSTRAVVNQSSQLILPALRSLPNNPFLRSMERQAQGEAELQQALWILIGLQIALVGILFLLGRLLWHAHKRAGKPLALPATPILSIVIVFVGLYVVIQPFLSFSPMDYRDSTTLLCLLQPLLVAVVIRIMQHKAVRVFYAYVGINVLLIVVPIVLFGIPRVISLAPPMIHDVEQQEELKQNEQLGIAPWLLIQRFRTYFLQDHHTEVVTFLTQRDLNHTVLIADPRYTLFLHHSKQSSLPARLFSLADNYREITDWLEHGNCQSQYDTFIVLMRVEDPDSMNIDDVIPRIERKCPHLTRTNLSDDTVMYQLEHMERQ